MKKTIFLIAVISAFLSFTSCNNGGDKPTDGTDTTVVNEDVTSEVPSNRVYNVESGYIKFNTSMGMTRELWWDEYGMKQYEENYMEIMGIKSGSNSLTLDGIKYDWDPTTKQGTKMKFSFAPPTEYDDMPAEEISKYGIKFEGTQKIAGKECQVISITEPMATKTWTWNGIALKSETPIGKGVMTMEAIEVKEEAVDASKFQLPTDVKFKEYK